MAYLGFAETDANVTGNKYEHIIPDGIATTFTLGTTVPGALAQNIQVILNNIPQEPDAAYSINQSNWNQIVFSEVPLVSDVIYVVHRGSGVNYSQPSANSVGTNELAANLKTFVNDTFSGTGAQVNFTLSQAALTNTVLVTVSGVVQVPTTDFSVSSTTLTFTTAPPNGVAINVLQLGFPTGFSNFLPSNIVKVTTLETGFVLPVAKGGTNATDAAGARTSLGVEAALPSGVGLPGYVLTTDNAGVKSWTLIQPNNILLSMGII